MKPLFEKFYDGTHCGISDFYSDVEKTLTDALTSGNPFDTGWYSSKKEIQSGRIEKDTDKITVSVSVSDDFDTIGQASIDIPVDSELETICSALDECADLAEQDKEENQNYCGFSILNNGRWMYTLILPVRDALEWDMAPGGDYYQEWGWQEETPDISAKCKNVLDRFAHNYTYNLENTRERLIKHGITCGEWTIQPWDES